MPTRTVPLAAVSSPWPFATPFSNPPQYEEPSSKDKKPDWTDKGAGGGGECRCFSTM